MIASTQRRSEDRESWTAGPLAVGPRRPKMPTMHSATVTPLVSARERGRRVARAVDARRRLDAARRERRERRRAGGRVWLNGSELGDARGALGHLAEIYD